MKELREAIEKLLQYVEEHRLSNAAIKFIPYIGDALDELVHGGDIEKLIKKVATESESRQNEILNKLTALIRQSEESQPLIICVGSGSAEEILKLEDELVIGEKHTVLLEELFGGSGVNYTLRLINAGFDVLPILAVGQDGIGRSIREQIFKAFKASQSSPIVSSFMKEDDGREFFDPNIKTSSTTIVVHNARRTIFTQKLRNVEYFIHHLKRRMEEALKLAPVYPAAVMIGHLHSNSKLGSFFNFLHSFIIV